MSAFPDRTDTEIDLQKEAARYRAAWEDFRVYLGWYWLPFLTYIPGVLFFGWLLSFAFNDNLAHGIVAFSWMALWIVAGRGYSQFLCPRCGKKFFSRKGWSTIFTSKCLNCGLRAYAQNSQDETPEETFQPPLPGV